jgi:hypothetical protein
MEASEPALAACLKPRGWRLPDGMEMSKMPQVRMQISFEYAEAW